MLNEIKEAIEGLILLNYLPGNISNLQEAIEIEAKGMEHTDLKQNLIETFQQLSKEVMNSQRGFVVKNSFGYFIPVFPKDLRLIQSAIIAALRIEPNNTANQQRNLINSKLPSMEQIMLCDLLNHSESIQFTEYHKLPAIGKVSLGLN